MMSLSKKGFMGLLLNPYVIVLILIIVVVFIYNFGHDYFIPKY